MENRRKHNLVKGTTETPEHYGDNPNCVHEWVHSDITIDTYPPMTHISCIKCKRVEHRDIDKLGNIPSYNNNPWLISV